jgi:hypothetical protein
MHYICNDLKSEILHFIYLPKFNTRLLNKDWCKSYDKIDNNIHILLQIKKLYKSIKSTDLNVLYNHTQLYEKQFNKLKDIIHDKHDEYDRNLLINRVYNYISKFKEIINFSQLDYCHDDTVYTKVFTYNVTLNNVLYNIELEHSDDGYEWGPRHECYVHFVLNINNVKYFNIDKCYNTKHLIYKIYNINTINNILTLIAIFMFDVYVGNCLGPLYNNIIKLENVIFS